MFVRVLVAPGQPPIHLYVLCIVWCVLVGGAFAVFFNTAFARFRTAIRLTISSSDDVLLINGKSMKIDSFRFGLDAATPHICIFADGQKYFVTNSWNGFDEAVQYFQKVK
jgi:hypothetical protein